MSLQQWTHCFIHFFLFHSSFIYFLSDPARPTLLALSSEERVPLSPKSKMSLWRSEHWTLCQLQRLFQPHCEWDCTSNCRTFGNSGFCLIALNVVEAFTCYFMWRHRYLLLSHDRQSLKHEICLAALISRLLTQTHRLFHRKTISRRSKLIFTFLVLD